MIAGYWKQLKPILLKDNVILLDVVKTEIEKGKDALTEWISSIEGLEVLDKRDVEIIAKYKEILN